MVMEHQPRYWDLVRNTVYADGGHEGPDGNGPAIFRICWIDVAQDIIGVVQLNNDKSLPRTIAVSEVKDGIAAGHIRLPVRDDWIANPDIVVASIDKANDLSEKIRKQLSRTNSTCKLLKPTFVSRERELFDAKTRGQVVDAITAELGVTKPFVYKWIGRFFRRGMTDAAFATNHGRCGAPGKERVPGEIKRGAPPSLNKRTSEAPGINIGEQVQNILYQGWKRYKVRDKLSTRDAFDSTLGQYFAKGYEMRAGIPVPILPSKDCLPTIEQFKYWGTKNRNKRLDRVAQVSQREYNLKHRATPGNAREGATGPGQIFQVDATGGKISIVARDDRRITIGKAVVYFVIDTYSQLIAGWACALESASYAVMSQALERAFTTKVAYCKRFNIDINDEDFPTLIVPEQILGDHGPELMGHQADYATQLLGFVFMDPAVGRPEQKSYVERAIGHIKQTLKDIPGASNGPRERGKKNPADDACLTLDEYESIVVHLILAFNHSYEIKNHPDAHHLEAERLPLTPINFWNWGMANRSGSGRRFDAEYIRAALMPKADVPAKSDGLIFKELAYMSRTLDEQGVFLRSTGHKRQRFLIAYDPRDLSEIWLVSRDGRLIERCPLSPKFAHYRGISLWELEELRRAGTPLRISASTNRSAVSCGVRTKIRNIVDNAKTEQAALSKNKSAYDENARRVEQAERREEEAWTKDTEKNNDEQPMGDYVPPPDYDSILSKS